jgi:hypothetical protein
MRALFCWSYFWESFAFGPYSYIPTYVCCLFKEIVCMNYWKLMNIAQAIFKKATVLFSKVLRSAPIFELECLYWPGTDMRDNCMLCIVCSIQDEFPLPFYPLYLTYWYVEKSWNMKLLVLQFSPAPQVLQSYKCNNWYTTWIHRPWEDQISP